jgi:hypothetical protein
VGNGNGIDPVTPTGKPGQPIIEDSAPKEAASQPRLELSNPPKAEPPKNCGAMSEQRSDIANQPAPQKFVHLVGCRDPRLRPGPPARPRASPFKQ